ncbi:hypothetical protein [Pseudalkalibacillus caeni]|uniref:DUF885 domain-containing protein n=1 Tax=Exobacillus caeni TaxID=2574798 RepID=A0A5R9F3T6_9BACL|nr:hypothetical protein [Pseudalkalibacillus caeni]TLS36268.1 hypothetical protein FCL54_16675 [Pseudalkalibacillus caeni]
MVLRWTAEPTGEAIVNVVLSLNEQAQKLHGQEVATASYSNVKPTLKSFDEIGLKIDEIESAIQDLKGHEGRYLRSMVNAFRYFGYSLQGDDLSYEEYIANIQELPSTLITEEQITRQQEIVEEGLTNLGYKGTFKEKADKWHTDTLIDPEKVTAVAESLKEKSKQGTLERVIRLPEEDGINTIKSIRDVFWSGYSKYSGNFRGNLTFNIDRPWTEPVLAQIMCHEGYPGHQAFYCRWDYLFQQGKLPLEASYYLINTPTNALFEGGPESALHFLAWDRDEQETEGITKQAKQQYKLGRDYIDYQRMAMTNACYMYNFGQFNKEEAVEYMITTGNLTSVEANNCYRFFSDPIQRTYYPSYYYGRWMVGKAYDAVEKEKRADFFKVLYDTPHTTNTFIDAVSKLTGKEFAPFDRVKTAEEDFAL